MYVKHFSLRCVLSLSIFFLVSSMFIKTSSVDSDKPGDIAARNRVNVNTKLLLVTQKIVGVDANKKDVCQTVKRLYERAITNKKNITWNEIFLSLESLYSNQQNYLKERKTIIKQAKDFCPTYQDAVRILEADNREISTS